MLSGTLTKPARLGDGWYAVLDTEDRAGEGPAVYLGKGRQPDKTALIDYVLENYDAKNPEGRRLPLLLYHHVGPYTERFVGEVFLPPEPPSCNCPQGHEWGPLDEPKQSDFEACRFCGALHLPERAKVSYERPKRRH